MIPAFLLTKAGRYVAIAVAVALLLGFVYTKGRGDGAQSERTRIAKDELEPLRKEMESARSEFGQQLAALKFQESQKDAIIAQQQQAIARLDMRLADLDRQRQIQAQQIATLTDAETFFDLTARLALRQPQDKTQTLYPQEIRKADAIIADYELQGQTLVETQGKVAAQAEVISTLEAKQKITEQKVSAALSYIEQADARFKNAYNIFYRTHRRATWLKVITFGIIRDRKIQELTPVVAPPKPTT